MAEHLFSALLSAGHARIWPKPHLAKKIRIWPGHFRDRIWPNRIWPELVFQSFDRIWPESVFLVFCLRLCVCVFQDFGCVQVCVCVVCVWCCVVLGVFNCVCCVCCVQDFSWVSSRFLVGVFKIFGRCRFLVGVFKIFGPLRWTPSPSAGPPPPPDRPSAGRPLRWMAPLPDRPKFRSFFFSLPPEISFFLLSLGGSSR